MIDAIKNLPDVKIKVVNNDKIIETSSSSLGVGKKIIIFGVPGAFTSTCSLKHFPDFLESLPDLKKKEIDHIYCMSVNDPFVMKAWQGQYKNGSEIIMIADGNADLTKALEIDKDYSSSYMGIRCKRFALMAIDNKIVFLNIEKPGQYDVSSPSFILSQLK